MPLTRRHLATVAALAAAGSAAGWLVRRDRASRQRLPSLPYTLLDGRPHNLGDLRGQVVLVSFWATTCSICVAEMPALVATHEKFRARGLQTLAVAMQYDPPAYVADFAERRQLPFGVAIDNTGAIAQGFGGVQGTPTSVLVDRRGEIVERHQGAVDFTKLHARLAQLLGEA